MIKLKTQNFLKIIFIFTLITACNDEVNEQNFKHLDLNTYKSLKSELTILKPIDLNRIRNVYEISNSLHKTGSDIQQTIVDEVNETFEEEVLQIEAVEYIEYEGEEILTKGLEDGVFTELDVEIVNDVTDDIINLGVDSAIQNMENRLNQSNVSELEFDRYNQFANQLLLNIEANYASNNLETEFANAEGPGWRCLLAIAAYTLSTVAVGAACVPNPTTPISCPLAITQSAIAYTAMIGACKKDKNPQINDQ